MRAIGIKALKDKLSAYVRMASMGETVLVTDRERVVAELGPPRPERGVTVLDAVLAGAVRDGCLTPAAVARQGPPPRLPVARTAAILAELELDRSDR